MTTEIAPKPNQLSKILTDSGLAADKAGAIIETLAPLVEQAGDLCREAETITVTAADQLTEMRQAREIRLKLVKVRTGAEAARKTLKSDALALGRAIDACGNWIKAQTEPVEARLMECELFAERAEARRKQALRDERYSLLAAVGPVDAAIVSTLGDMGQGAFDAMLQGAKLAKVAREEEANRQEQARRDEEARRARELEEARAKQAQAEREAAKLRAEREAIEAEARAQREAAEAKAEKERREIRAKAAAEHAEAERKFRAEREAREKLEREQRERDAAEKKRRDAEARAAKKAAAAPDADKLRAYAKALRSIPAPTFKTQDGCDAFAIAECKVVELAADIERAADAIGGGE